VEDLLPLNLSTSAFSFPPFAFCFKLSAFSFFLSLQLSESILLFIESNFLFEKKIIHLIVPVQAMPIFMDLHTAPGVTAKDVAEAHILDVKIQHRFGCKAMTYWVDEDKGSIFCLIEAPDKEAVRTMHEQSHGLIPNEIILVNTDVVKAFLGRIKDPENAIQHPDTNLKVFNDPAFRVILVTKTTDVRLLQHALGKERAQELLLLYSTIVREQSRNCGGCEVYQKEEGNVVSFVSGLQAIECALAIQKKLLSAAGALGLKIGLHAGVPVNNKSDSIFGTTIRFAQFLCGIGKANQILMSSIVRNLYKDNDWTTVVRQNDIRGLSTGDENFLEALVDTLAKNWQDSEFDIADFCQAMSISKPQLYRKCIAVTEMSPNTLLREYRLLRSLELLRKEDHNISQTTFDTGFSSPSYFTKCFQKRFGLQPLTYLKTHV
jgi:AraC-like DNA-binding protein